MATSTLAPIADQPALERTRGSWHRVAEHVLAPVRHAVTGRIGLRATPGGFGTPPYERQGTVEEVRVVRDLLHVQRGSRTEHHPLTTLRAAAAVVGIEPGAPTDVYHPTTPLDADAALAIDPAAADVLAAWFDLGWTLLEELGAAATPDDAASTVQLWPEHFDAAIELGDERRGSRGTFGSSPGDAQHELPYLYVTHWAGVADDPFWNEPTFGGASIGYEALAAAGDALAAGRAFFQAGRARLSAAA